MKKKISQILSVVLFVATISTPLTAEAWVWYVAKAALAYTANKAVGNPKKQVIKKVGNMYRPYKTPIKKTRGGHRFEVREKDSRFRRF